MKIRPFAAAMVFVGSYLPLSVILLAQDFKYGALASPICLAWPNIATDCQLPFRSPLISISTFLVCSACFLATLYVLRIVESKRTIEVVSAKHIPSDLMNYTLPYVVAFMNLDYQETGKFVGLLIFLAWMFWISYRSDQVILNPVLAVFGWRLYEISFRNEGSVLERHGYALSGKWLAPGQPYTFTKIQEVIVIQPSLPERD